MILTFGVLLCTFAMLLFSLSRWEKKRRRVETLRFLFRLVRSVRTGVADHCTPLPRIFSSFSECGEEEHAFLSELSANGVKTALDRYGDILTIDEEDRKAVLEFFSACKTGYRGTVTTLCDSFLRTLAERIDPLEGRLMSELRLALLLPLTVGTLILLLFL